MVGQPGLTGPTTDILNMLTPALVAGCSAVIIIVWLLLRQFKPTSGSPGSLSGCAASATSEADGPGDGQRRRGKDGHNLQGTFVPSTGLIEANSLRAYPFDNDMCCGCFLPMHRPTTDKALNASCDYVGGAHFKGRKRLWEMRLQFNVKHDVARPMMFGIELEEYVPLNAATKKLMSITVAALRQAAGKDLYHSPGDDPQTTPEPHEKPVFAMPLWAFDQFIVTPEGEEPPDLADPHFCEFGNRRTDDRAGFINEMSKLEMKAGPTYTFAFWGISQFLDDIKWEVQKVIPFKSIDFNMFCGAPPVHLVLYTLSPENADGESRHLQHRKEFYFHIAFWSSKKPPSKTRIRQLLPNVETHGGQGVEVNGSQSGLRSRIPKLFNCCVQHREQRLNQSP